MSTNQSTQIPRALARTQSPTPHPDRNLLSTEEGAEITPDSILQLGLGFWGSKTLLSAVELGLFTLLSTGLDRDGEVLAGPVELRGDEGLIVALDHAATTA